MARISRRRAIYSVIWPSILDKNRIVARTVINAFGFQTFCWNTKELTLVKSLTNARYLIVNLYFVYAYFNSWFFSEFSRYAIDVSALVQITLRICGRIGRNHTFWEKQDRWRLIQSTQKHNYWNVNSAEQVTTELYLSGKENFLTHFCYRFPSRICFPDTCSCTQRRRAKIALPPL